jgi:hypothetical protein
MYGWSQPKTTPKGKYAIDYSENDDLCERMIRRWVMMLMICTD